MRILVTNDDGVHAPGLAAITRALAAWAGDSADREVLVVAPLANHSGASAAVGTVYEREALAYRAVPIDGADNVAVYGLDASPALSVIVGILGGFGPRPDLVVSGINLGVNVGRSVLHSGTVGAALTGAQLGLSGLAVSLRSGAARDHWETAADLAVALLPILTAAPARTVLNLNVPSVPEAELRGVRRGRISTAGIVKRATGGPGGGGPASGGPGGGGPGGGGPASGGPGAGGDPEEGEIRLTLGTAIPSLGDVEGEDPEDDAALIAAGYASLTALLGVREDTASGADDLVRQAVTELQGTVRP